MTKLLVLALLGTQPMSGYEIKLMLEMNDAQRWAGVLPGSIYHALKTLEKDGFIEVASLENQGHRQKAIYKITAKGEAYQQELALDCLRNAKIYYPTELYSGLSYVYGLPKEAAVTALKANLKALTAEGEAVQKGITAKEKILQGESVPKLNKIVFDHMFEVIESQIKLVQRALNMIEEK